jgi:phospholipid-binding lipoprotein MlaA
LKPFTSAKVKQLFTVTFFFLSLLLSGCATTAQKQTAEQKDPFENINRSFWTFNWDYLDKYITRPVAVAYADYTPTLVRKGLYNFVQNLDEPSTVINDLLQLKFVDAAQTTGRFVVNSTVGLLGFFDPASHLGWHRKQEEFGEVLGVYGISNGPYLMLPALGPSTVREEVGDYVDRLYWPLAIIDFWPNIVRLSVLGLEERAQLLEQEALLTESLDPYIFVKNAYFQNLRFKVYDGNPPMEVNEEEDAELDSFMDELDDIDQPK